MTNTHIHITRSQKLHLGDGDRRNCDKRNRWNDPGYTPTVNGSAAEGLRGILRKGRAHVEGRTCKRCFPLNDAFDVMQELASR